MNKVSTATNSVATQLSDTYMRESASAFRFTLWVSFFTLFFLIISSFISRMCFRACAHSIMNDSLTYEPIQFKKYNLREDFKNNQLEGSQFSFNYKTASQHQTIGLTSLDIKDKNAPSNMFIGQADRHLSVQNDKIQVIIDIFANLYVLGGNVFGETLKDQEYRAYGYTLDNKKIDLGQLEKSGDGLYKLKIMSNDPNILEYNTIQIVYKTPQTEVVLLNGAFKRIH